MPSSVESEEEKNNIMSGSKSNNKDVGFFSGLIASLWEPGVNPALKLLLHIVFVSLIASLLGILHALGWKNLHAWVLLSITCILYGIIVWFVAEVHATMLEQHKLEEASKHEANSNRTD